MVKDIAICIPYFERLGALLRTIHSFEAAGYFAQDYPCRVSVSVCDDGSINEPAPEHERYTLTRLPKKKEWKTPTTSMNAAVSGSSGELIVLQSPETYHPSAVVHLMADLVEGWKDVVQVACRDETRGPNAWFNHPDNDPNKFWFCQMLTRKMWNHVGGFSEDYRNFAHGEDGDFALKLTSAEATWRWVRNAHVVHGWRGAFPKRGPKPYRKLETDHGPISYDRYLT